MAGNRASAGECDRASHGGHIPATNESTPLAPGLYLVATPIGNLGDITLRALDVLRRADRIACEDTRQTQKLLNHFQIATPTVSCHAHNERERAVKLVEELKAGARIALVSDAGTPCVSDPGAWLVQAAIAAGVAVIPIPGPNAAVSALVASGLPAGEFRFLGFLPEKAGARRTRLETLAAEAANCDLTQTLIFYEAPHRILDALADLEAVWGAGPRVVIARELTKVHEEFLRGTAGELRRELASRERVRGEMTVLVEARGKDSIGGAEGSGADTNAAAAESVAAGLTRQMRERGIDEKEALKRLARERGLSKSELYRELQRERARRR